MAKNNNYTQGYREVFYILVLIALVLQLYAISTSHWSVKKMTPPQGAKKDVLHYGLWKVCETVSLPKSPNDNTKMTDTVCSHLPPHDNNLFPKNSLYCVRIFSLLSVCLLFASLMMLMYNQKYNKYQMVLLVASIICSIISSSVYASELLKIKEKDQNNKVSETDFKPGYSYYLNVLSIVPAVAGLLYLKYTRF
jgi:Na+/melibiose symporter-like transporter